MKITVGSKQVDLSSPVVMTIINITPDSFYAASRTVETDAVRQRIAAAMEQGAALLDVGGYSSRPGADDVTPGEEIRRIGAAMEIIRREHGDVPVSLDTFRAGVADTIIRNYGPCIINDITAGGADSGIIAVAAHHKVPYIAMHMRGNPQNMQRQTSYGNITAEISDYFRIKLQELAAAGVEDIILDPGFGFSKTLEQNYELLAHMNIFRQFGRPMLAGISRKSMIYKHLGTDPAGALNGTTALHWECLRQGADILRVHDTAEAAEVVRLFNLYKRFAG